MAKSWLRDSLSTVTLAPSSLLRVFIIDAFPVHRPPSLWAQRQGAAFCRQPFHTVCLAGALDLVMG